MIAVYLGSLLAVLDNDSQSSRWRLLELRATSRAAPATPCPSRRRRHHGEGGGPREKGKGRPQGQAGSWRRSQGGQGEAMRLTCVGTPFCFDYM